MVEVSGWKLPSSRTGVLFYYPFNRNDTRHPPLIFRFASLFAWTDGRPAPFAWRLIEPHGKLTHPVLDLVADRFTEIIPPAIYGRKEGPAPSRFTPLVRIFRPQIAHGVPQDEEAFRPENILGNTGGVYGTSERTRRIGVLADPDLHKFRIDHLPVSNQGKLRGKPVCVVTNILGNYQLQLLLKNIWKPVAYWVEIDDADRIVHSHTAVIWTYVDRNIEHRNILYAEKGSKLDVFRRFLAGVNQRGAIPEFTDNVVTSSSDWNPKNDWLLPEKETRIPSERPEGYWWRQFVQSAEDFVGMIPVWGDIYDVGSIAYTSVTGKAPWTGDPVSRAETAVYAAAVVGPLSVSQLRRFHGFTRDLPRDLAKLSDDAFLDYADNLLEPGFVMEVASAASDKTMRELKLKLLAATGKNVTGIKSREFADYFLKLLAEETDVSDIGKRFDALKQYTKIDEIFVSPSELREPLLSSYEAFLKRTKHTSDEKSPLEWLRQQTSGKSSEVLVRVLGPNYLGKLRVLAGSAKTVPKANLVKIAQLLRAGELGNVDNYKDLAKNARGLYPVVESDHIFEKRFFLNNPDFSESMDMYENSLAVLVPSNHDMRRAILEIDPRAKFPYVHADKTQLMRKLLPHGGEHLYDLQALWDAHVYTYRQLGVKLSPNGSSFGALVYQELVDNLDYLAHDLRMSGRAEKATYKKRFDPKDRAFRDQRFENSGWWALRDS